MWNTAPSKASGYRRDASAYQFFAPALRKPRVHRPGWLIKLAQLLHLRLRAPRRAAEDVATPMPAALVPVERAALTASFEPLYLFAPRLRRAWSASTSVLPGLWSAQRPALGQSATTACALQDVLGGDIVRSKAVLADGRTISHYANVVEGLVIDLAQSEIDRAASVGEAEGRHDGYASMREYVLAQPGVAKGYAALKRRLADMAA
jgi:hypothetical protein